jgi:hypothetical protein
MDRISGEEGELGRIKVIFTTPPMISSLNFFFFSFFRGDVGALT